MPFTCSICGEESTRICVRCTKDACDNHLCEKCRKCSDCCECEVALTPHPAESVREALHGTPPASEPAVEVPAVEVPMEAVEVAPLDVVEAMAVAPIDTIESLGMAADAGALGDEEAGNEPEEHEPEAAQFESHEPEDPGSEEPPVV